MAAHKPNFSFPSSGNHVPEDQDQRLVRTPYGRGLVIRTREPDLKTGVRLREVQLLDWNKGVQPTHGPIRPSILYSPTDFASVTPRVGDDVLTVYGRGRVTDIRPDTSTLVILLSSWRLAGRSRVTCYLHPSSVEVVRDKKIYEMSTAEKVEHAQTLKTKAMQQFKSAKDYRTALETFSRAVDAVRYVQHRPDSTNETRADLLVVMITCSNNAGTCCTQLGQWDEAYKFAKNALVLIDALEEKKGKRIHTILNREGFSDLKLFGEWRVKSYLIMARALTEQSESSQAMEILKTAHEVIVKYTAEPPQQQQQKAQFQKSVKQLLANDKEIKKLHAIAKDQRKAHLKKEKLRAQAMFGSNSRLSGSLEEEEEEEEKKEPASPTEPATPTRSRPNRITATPENGGTKSPANRPKKRVSFAKQVDEDDVDEGVDDHSAFEGSSLEWYQDPEVLAGLAIFAGSVVATVAGLSYLFSRKR